MQKLKKNINKKIFLTGFMGSGKTTVGRLLAEELFISFLDLDDFITEKYKITIPEIFEKYGEVFFRKVETECLKEIISNNNSFVLATGGGIVLKKENIDIMKENGVIIFLEASVDTIFKRLKNDLTRPLLNVDDKYKKIFDLLDKRKSFYLNYDFKVNVDDKPKEIVVSEIKKLFFL